MKDFNLLASDTRSITGTIEPISSLFDSVRGDTINDIDHTQEQTGPILGGLNF